LGRALLAPMAGITDLPFRGICVAQGAALATSEMLTSDINLWQSEKSKSRLQLSQNNPSPKSIQIAGSEPQQLASAARAAASLGAEIVDINMGCPAKKVCKKLAGSALLKDEKIVKDILHAVVNAVDVPVTLKTRTGWDQDHKNGLHVAKIAEDAGIQALAIHGRTRACRFNGFAEYDSIAEIVNAVSIPVIANGDITDAQKALTVLEYTKAKAVMIGRAAFGNPWIFKQVNYALNAKRHGETPSTEAHNNSTTFVPTIHEVVNTISKHLKALHEFYGPLKGHRIARKHFAWYFKLHSQLEECEIKDKIKHFNAIEEAEKQITFTKNCFNNCPDKEEIAA